MAGAWNSVLCVSARVCVGQTAGFPLQASQRPGRPAAPAVPLTPASLEPAAQTYTDVNQAISTSQFGKEVWPNGDVRVELKGVGVGSKL